MIHTATSNPKFTKLVRRLRNVLGRDLPVDTETVAVGVLERIWHVCIHAARRGDIGRFDNEAIAEAAGWFGDADQLVEMLVETGWLDECDEHRLVIHDWSEHCPQFLKRNIKREGGFAEPRVAKSDLDDSAESLRGVLNTQPSTQELTPNITQPNLTKPNQSSFVISDAEDEKQEDVSEGDPEKISTTEFFDRWNAFAEKTPGIKTIRKLTPERLRKLRSRLKSKPWFGDFKEASRCLPLPGGVDNWQPTFDWMIANENNIYKILEGHFDFREKENKSARDLADRRRKNAYEDRQREEQCKKEQRKQDRGRRKATESILRAASGSESDESERSLLFGAEGDSSASGAAK